VILFLLAAFFVEPSVFVGSSLRRLNYRDRLSPTLGSWQSGALAVGGFGIVAYPDTGRLPVIDDIGVYGSIARSLSAQTLTADGELAFSTRATTWDLGLRYRQEHFALAVGYGSLRHDFGGARLPGFLLPSGLVQYWRFAPSVRFASIEAGAAWLAIVRQDFLSTWFPRAAKGGLEGFVKATMPVWKVNLTLTARYQRYFYSLRPQPYDPFIAGGALDEVFSLDLACGYRL
jgi:hypothetical protein